MFNYTPLYALLMASFVLLTYAEPLHFRTAQRPAPSRFLARQEAAPLDDADDVEPAQLPPIDGLKTAPYPAAGITPAIPFDLPTETEAPVPDETYGPPEEEPTPDPTYGPPTASTTLTASAADGDVVSQNLVQQRQKAALLKRRGLMRSQRLLLQAVPVAGTSHVVEVERTEPGVIYILK